MRDSLKDFGQLLTEYDALLRQHGMAQRLCSAVILQQQALMQSLEEKIVKLRAAVIVRDSKLAFLQQDMMSVAVAGRALPGKALDASLAAADLVICQTGCLSHGQYWRVQDHCKRTGKTCVLVEQPEAVRIVRIHKAAQDSIESS